MSDILLNLKGMTKLYPSVRANDDVTFDIQKGEIHALLGENGAGKSTLVKMIYGLVQPDVGAMQWNGENFTPFDPRAARAAGVAMVFQHFSLFDALSVAENIALGMENPPKMSELADRITTVSEAYDLPLDPNRLVGDLSAGESQRVEIIRCLLQNPKLLIMDEPTSVLTPQEVGILFKTLRKLREEETSILYISHKLEEIRTLCETATILRDGKKVATCNPREKTARELAEMMVGAALDPAKNSDNAVAGSVALKLRNLILPPQSAFGTALYDISFDLYKGEILGIGGVAGNGQDELLGCLSGEIQNTAQLELHGTDINAFDPNARRAAGLCTAPEERLGHAAAPDMSLIQNTMLTAMVRMGLSKRGVLNWGKARDFTNKIIKEFDVRTPSATSTARSLSGGNLQKFVIGREILQNPSVLVVNQPTWGVDAAAAAAIHRALLALAQGGAAVIVISQDLDELIQISTRFMALNAGRLSAARAMAGLTLDEIGLMLGGADVAA